MKFTRNHKLVAFGILSLVTLASAATALSHMTTAKADMSSVNAGKAIKQSMILEDTLADKNRKLRADMQKKRREYEFKALEKKQAAERVANLKCFFPQSFTFKSDSDFSDERSISGELLAACNLAGSTLTIVAREAKSFDLFKKHFPNNNILLTPDIVLSLNARGNYYVAHASEYKRGVKLFMHEPGEKVLDASVRENFVTSLKMLQGHIDMNAEDYPSDVSIDGRKLALNKLWEIIAGNEVLVTDQLHGLIFAHITGTPCLVFDNHNSKIKMTVKDWLSNTPGVVFVDTREPLVADDLVKLVDDLSGKTVAPFDAAQAYAPLTDILNQYIND